MQPWGVAVSRLLRDLARRGHNVSGNRHWPSAVRRPRSRVRLEVPAGSVITAIKARRARCRRERCHRSPQRQGRQSPLAVRPRLTGGAPFRGRVQGPRLESTGLPRQGAHRRLVRTIRDPPRQFVSLPAPLRSRRRLVEAGWRIAQGPGRPFGRNTFIADATARGDLDGLPILRAICADRQAVHPVLGEAVSPTWRAACMFWRKRPAIGA